jgi:hypothetical protein
MRKISLALMGCYCSLLSAFAQPPAEIDTSTYSNRKLKIDEVNFISSYYNQTGNKAAVTGGIGSENLTDISNLLELKLVKADAKKRSRLLTLQLGVDAYTSASSDNIDPATISSASRSERRIYPTISYSVKNNVKRRAIGFIGYYSTEYDYTSLSPGFTFTKFSEDNNKELTVKLQAFFDNRKIILPIELRNTPDVFSGTTNRNTYNASFIYSRVINQRAQLALLIDVAYQSGLLSIPFNRVYFSDNELRIEKLPASRFKLPLGLRFNYFLNDRFVVRSFYRFYYDTWNLIAHTFSVELPVKITPFLSVGPVYRFYTQSAADQFAPYKEHNPSDEFYTSDYDLSRFTSQLIGLNLRKVSAEGVFGIKKLNSVELRYAYYHRTTPLTAHTIALAFRIR